MHRAPFSRQLKSRFERRANDRFQLDVPIFSIWIISFVLISDDSVLSERPILHSEIGYFMLSICCSTPVNCTLWRFLCIGRVLRTRLPCELWLYSICLRLIKWNANKSSQHSIGIECVFCKFYEFNSSLGTCDGKIYNLNSSAVAFSPFSNSVTLPAHTHNAVSVQCTHDSPLFVSHRIRLENISARNGVSLVDKLHLHTRSIAVPAVPTWPSNHGNVCTKQAGPF